MGDETQTTTGGCMCGAVRYEAIGEPLGAGHCHCSSCRRHTGAPVVTFVAFEAQQVRFPKEERRIYASSPGVGRAFCDQCGTPLTWEGYARTWDKSIIEVHISTLDDPDAYAPDRHWFHGERIAWFDVADYHADLAEDGEYPWSGELRMLLVPGGYLSEAVFFHDATGTLVITDLIQNYEREKIASPFFRFMSRLSGAVDPDGKMPLDLRATFFMHRKQMAEAVRTMISWQPQRIIIAHGRWYRGNAVAELERAFRWLPGIPR